MSFVSIGQRRTKRTDPRSKLPGSMKGAFMSKRIGPLACLFVSSILMGIACASVSPPTDQISAAEAAIRQAESLGAVELAPLQMRVAREKLDEARSIAQNEDGDHMRRAKRLAEESALEARLAEETARTAAFEKARNDAAATIDAMRREAGLDAN